MANHVSFSISFHEMNDAAKAKLNEIIENAEVQSDGDISFGELIKQDIDREEKQSYSWMIDNVGPKWCHVQDIDEHGMHGYSAWDAPIMGFETLLETLTKEDPQLISSIQYEDEMPNFAGGYIYDGTDVYDGIEYDEEDIINLVIDGCDDLQNEDFDWDEHEFVDEEKRDIYYEALYEILGESIWNLIAEEVVRLKEFNNPTK